MRPAVLGDGAPEGVEPTLVLGRRREPRAFQVPALLVLNHGAAIAQRLGAGGGRGHHVGLDRVAVELGLLFVARLDLDLAALTRLGLGRLGELGDELVQLFLARPRLLELLFRQLAILEVLQCPAGNLAWRQALGSDRLCGILLAVGDVFQRLGFILARRSRFAVTAPTSCLGKSALTRGGSPRLVAGLVARLAGGAARFLAGLTAGGLGLAARAPLGRGGLAFAGFSRLLAGASGLGCVLVLALTFAGLA